MLIDPIAPPDALERVAPAALPAEQVPADRGGLRRTAGACVLACVPAIAALTAVRPEAWAVPPGFVQEQVGVPWVGRPIVGVRFDADGTPIVWERAGRVWQLDGAGAPLPDPIIDIREEVGNWWDHGLLGVLIGPGPTGEERFLYLLYVVDHHHLMHFGTPQYDPAANAYFRATIGRVTRYRLTRDGGGAWLADASSRTILIGEDHMHGIPVMHASHGVGTIEFGADGSLLISAGDTASFSSVDVGNDSGGSYALQGIAEGILRLKENVGAYRAQLVDCLAGKILRIDPGSGDGLPDNPWFNAAEPRAAASRVWSLGQRNPFRFSVRHVGNATGPGHILYGDVGWGQWEEYSVVTGPGQNCGWPAFEGMETQSSYWNASPANLDAPNPLYIPGVSPCNLSHFRFRDLIRQDTLDPSPHFPNPCDPDIAVPATTPTFIHRRPILDYFHAPNGPARIPVFDGLNAATFDLGSPGCPVPGTPFGGNSATGGAWHEHPGFPAYWRSLAYHGDYVGNFIRAFRLDGQGRLLEVRSFAPNPGQVVCIAVNPVDGSLWYVDYPYRIKRIRYTGHPCYDADLSGDGDVGFTDLLILLGAFGDCRGGGLPCDADLDGSGTVDFADILILLSRWGAC